MSDRLAGALDRLAQLRARRPGTGSLDAVRDVVIVASSSRGGSSMFVETLRRSPALLNLQAEFNPFLSLVGRTWPESGTGSDALDPSHAALSAADRALFEQELLADCCVGGAVSIEDEGVAERLVGDVCWRLVAQWPCEDFELDWLEAQVRAALALHRAAFDLVDFHLTVLERVRVRHPAVDPWFYDLEEGRIRARFPELPVPEGPPGAQILEEPPFVLVGPRRVPSIEELGRLPLILKAPSNAYRLPFLVALFPAARMRVLHLTRNPAAAINGLVDGWLYRGFHAHSLDAPLQIRGYVDVRPADARSWKFDLPPGWQAWTQRSLTQVAGFQWRSAHAHTLDFLEAHPGVEAHRLRFEEVIGPIEQRLPAFEALADWLGIPLDPPLAAAVRDGLPPIMATSRPRRRRWFARAAQLAPVLGDPEVQSVAERISHDDPEHWI